jgi:RNA polymerase sigma-70 factor, ECF subfamily
MFQKTVSLEAEKNNPLSDEEVVEKVLAGEIALFEILMRRYNQRLYRVARSILKNDAEAEDVTQDAYVRAYTHLEQFEGSSKFATWLTKIAVHEALRRSRESRRFVNTDDLEGLGVIGVNQWQSNSEGPANSLLRSQMSEILKAAIDAIPAKYRVVFVLREVEGMSTEETAESLGLTIETVKSRLFRARAMLRKKINVRTTSALSSLHEFAGHRCDRIVRNVLRRIAEIHEGH